MARLTVDVPDSILEQEKAKELQQARKRIASLEKKVAELQKTYRDFRATVAASLDLYEDYPWE